jgi:DnaD/phage-associated family protein
LNRTWIKLYLEIVQDSKMAKLPNHLWRRAVELFLLAGGNGNDGALPPVEEMAWRLRLEETKLIEDLLGLAEVGVVHEAEPGKWVVVNFAKRQAAIVSTDRVREHRKRTRNEDETEVKRKGNAADSFSSSLSPSDSVSESEGGGVGEGAVFRAYEANIGLLTPQIADGLKAAIDDYSADWVQTAIEYATKHEKRSLAYVEGTLKGWKRDGLGKPSAGKGKKFGNEEVIRKVAANVR